MSAFLPKSVQNLIEEFERFPGVGPKSAARMAYYFLRAPEKRAKHLAHVLEDLHANTKQCQACFNIAESDPCGVCADTKRDAHQICVVEDPLDVVAFERGGAYEGLYFVLGGVISPADGVGPEEIRVDELVQRVRSEMEEIEEGSLELILATNPSMEGEATAVYISEQIEGIAAGKKNSEKGQTKLKITRLARGLPTGADLEYADSLTLKRALEGRTEF